MKTAGRASGPGRQDCGRREASLPLGGLRVRCLVMVASSLAVLRLVLVVRSSPLLATALPPVFLGPAFWAVLF